MRKCVLCKQVHPLTGAICSACLKQQMEAEINKTFDANVNEALSVQEPQWTPEDTPLLQGKVLGYRAWSLNGYRLGSMNQHIDAAWTLGVNEAKCQMDKLSWAFTENAACAHAPGKQCHCGFNAWHDVINVGATREAPVVGAILGWGKIEVHARGFRSQFAQPVAISWNPRQAWEDVEKIKAFASEIDIPCVRFDQLADEASKFGKPIHESLRPAQPPRSLFSASWSPYPAFSIGITPVVNMPFTVKCSKCGKQTPGDQVCSCTDPKKG